VTTTASQTLQPGSTIGRVAHAPLAALLLAALTVETIDHSTGYWQVAAFGLGPDLALCFGAGRGLAHGQIHPRAVGLYNLVHRFWGPLILVSLAALGIVSVGFFIGALAWGCHVALDRSLGYGLRARDGFHRP
jgi:hypothetical protein